MNYSELISAPSGEIEQKRQELEPVQESSSSKPEVIELMSFSDESEGIDEEYANNKCIFL